MRIISHIFIASIFLCGSAMESDPAAELLETLGVADTFMDKFEERHPELRGLDGSRPAKRGTSSRPSRCDAVTSRNCAQHTNAMFERHRERVVQGDRPSHATPAGYGDTPSDYSTEPSTMSSSGSGANTASPRDDALGPQPRQEDEDERREWTRRLIRHLETRAPGFVEQIGIMLNLEKKDCIVNVEDKMGLPELEDLFNQPSEVRKELPDGMKTLTMREKLKLCACILTSGSMWSPFKPSKFNKYYSDNWFGFKFDCIKSVFPKTKENFLKTNPTHLDEAYRTFWKHAIVRPLATEREMSVEEYLFLNWNQGMDYHLTVEYYNEAMEAANAANIGGGENERLHAHLKSVSPNLFRFTQKIGTRAAKKGKNK